MTANKWRVGRQQPKNVYEGDTLIGQFQGEGWARLAVLCVNEALAQPEPAGVDEKQPCIDYGSPRSVHEGIEWYRSRWLALRSRSAGETVGVPAKRVKCPNCDGSGRCDYGSEYAGPECQLCWGSGTISAEAAIAALQAPVPVAGLEPRGCPTPGACSCSAPVAVGEDELRQAFAADREPKS